MFSKYLQIITFIMCDRQIPNPKGLDPKGQNFCGQQRVKNPLNKMISY